MQWWNEQQRQQRNTLLRQEIRQAADQSRMVRKVHTYVLIIFVVLCIVRGIVVHGGDFWQWEWSWVDLLDGFIFSFGIILVVSLILTMINEETLSLRQEVIRLRYRIEDIEKEGTDEG